MKCKYYLILGQDRIDTTSDCIEVSDMITNIDDIELSYNRTALGGVVRKCSSTLNLCDEARDRLVDYYSANVLRSKGAFGVYRILNNWTYQPLFECPLDFTTFSYDSHIAKIGCLDNSVAAIIKANKNVKYEIPVNEIKDSVMLNFEGIRIKNEAKLFITGESVEGKRYTQIVKNCEGFYRYIPPVYYSDEDIVYNKKILLHDQEEALESRLRNGNADRNMNNTSYFLSCEDDVRIQFRTGTYYEAFLEGSAPLTDRGFELNLIRPSVDPYPRTIATGGAINTKIELKKGDKLQLCLVRLTSLQGFHSFGNCTFHFYNNDSLKWGDIAPAVNIDVIKPAALLNRLLVEMGITGASAQIQSTQRLDNTMIVASESIRAFKDAKLYTSFEHFCKYMEAEYGYVYRIEDGSLPIVRFMHRDDVFKNREIKHISILSEPEYSVASDRIYSDIEVGYNKQDYDLGNNGNDEYNFKHYYSTELGLKDKKLLLVSPYRADGYGFQEQAFKREDETSQSESDSNIFLVHISNPSTTTKYELDRSLPVSGVYTDTVFNAAFNPKYMAQANLSYLSSLCYGIKYTAADGNSEAQIGGEPLKTDIALGTPLFKAGNLSIKTNDMILPEEWDGYVSFTWMGKEFKGFLKSLDVNVAQNEVLEYELIEC